MISCDFRYPLVKHKIPLWYFFSLEAGMSGTYKEVPYSDESDLLNLATGTDVPRMTYPVFAEVNDSTTAIPTGAMNSAGGEPGPVTRNGGDAAVTNFPDPGSAVIPSFLRDAAHPYVCFFHLLFKALSVFTYWVVYMFTSDVTVTFVLTAVFLGLDFWTVKNISGRKLVGLRWWNRVNEDGTSEWIFESAGDRSGHHQSSLDKNVFWIGLYVFPVFWVFAAISNFLALSPNFVMLNVMGLMLSGTNAVGYTKCSRSGQQAVQDWASSMASAAVVSQLSSQTV